MKTAPIIFQQEQKMAERTKCFKKYKLLKNNKLERPEGAEHFDMSIVETTQKLRREVLKNEKNKIG